ncbi:unnamed protein product [Anisakis simplex]|uniref:C2H2-type domain-containing protein n=1 Tax=Anisakis simplex TaxID=6269 RepID=A0A0M3K5R6_ANISI|nr:unnamed protein product [Anisakis simplex]
MGETIVVLDRSVRPPSPQPQQQPQPQLQLQPQQLQQRSSASPPSSSTTVLETFENLALAPQQPDLDIESELGHEPADEQFETGSQLQQQGGNADMIEGGVQEALDKQSSQQQNIQEASSTGQIYSDAIYDACDTPVQDDANPATMGAIVETEKKIFTQIELLLTQIKGLRDNELKEMLDKFIRIYRYSFERCVFLPYPEGCEETDPHAALRHHLSLRLDQWNEWFADKGVDRTLGRRFKDPNSKNKARMEGDEARGLEEMKQRIQQIEQERLYEAELQKYQADQEKLEPIIPTTSEEAKRLEKEKKSEERRNARAERAKEKKRQKDVEFLRTVTLESAVGFVDEATLEVYKAKCHLCEDRLTDAKFMIIHEKIKHPMMFFCHYCDRTFAAHGPMRVHCETVHLGLPIDPPGRRPPERANCTKGNNSNNSMTAAWLASNNKTNNIINNNNNNVASGKSLIVKGENVSSANTGYGMKSRKIASVTSSIKAGTSADEDIGNRLRGKSLAPIRARSYVRSCEASELKTAREWNGNHSSGLVQLGAVGWGLGGEWAWWNYGVDVDIDVDRTDFDDNIQLSQLIKPKKLSWKQSAAAENDEQQPGPSGVNTRRSSPRRGGRGAGRRVVAAAGSRCEDMRAVDEVNVEGGTDDLIEDGHNVTNVAVRRRSKRIEETADAKSRVRRRKLRQQSAEEQAEDQMVNVDEGCDEQMLVGGNVVADGQAGEQRRSGDRDRDRIGEESAGGIVGTRRRRRRRRVTDNDNDINGNEGGDKICTVDDRLDSSLSVDEGVASTSFETNSGGVLQQNHLEMMSNSCGEGDRDRDGHAHGNEDARQQSKQQSSNSPMAQESTGVLHSGRGMNSSERVAEQEAANHQEDIDDAVLSTRNMSDSSDKGGDTMVITNRDKTTGTDTEEVRGVVATERDDIQRGSLTECGGSMANDFAPGSGYGSERLSMLATGTTCDMDLGGMGSSAQQQQQPKPRFREYRERIWARSRKFTQRITTERFYLRSTAITAAAAAAGDSVNGLNLGGDKSTANGLLKRSSSLPPYGIISIHQQYTRNALKPSQSENDLVKPLISRAITTNIVEVLDKLLADPFSLTSSDSSSSSTSSSTVGWMRSRSASSAGTSLSSAPVVYRKETVLRELDSSSVGTGAGAGVGVGAGVAAVGAQLGDAGIHSNSAASVGEGRIAPLVAAAAAGAGTIGSGQDDLVIRASDILRSLNSISSSSSSSSSDDSDSDSDDSSSSSSSSDSSSDNDSTDNGDKTTSKATDKTAALISGNDTATRLLLAQLRQLHSKRTDNINDNDNSNDKTNNEDENGSDRMHNILPTTDHASTDQLLMPADQVNDHASIINTSLDEHRNDMQQLARPFEVKMGVGEAEGASSARGPSRLAACTQQSSAERGAEAVESTAAVAEGYGSVSTSSNELLKRNYQRAQGQRGAAANVAASGSSGGGGATGLEATDGEGKAMGTGTGTGTPMGTGTDTNCAASGPLKLLRAVKITPKEKGKRAEPRVAKDRAISRASEILARMRKVVVQSKTAEGGDRDGGRSRQDQSKQSSSSETKGILKARQILARLRQQAQQAKSVQEDNNVVDEDDDDEGGDSNYGSVATAAKKRVREGNEVKYRKKRRDLGMKRRKKSALEPEITSTTLGSAICGTSDTGNNNK